MSISITDQLLYEELFHQNYIESFKLVAHQTTNPSIRNIRREHRKYRVSKQNPSPKIIPGNSPGYTFLKTKPNQLLEEKATIPFEQKLGLGQITYDNPHHRNTSNTLSLNIPTVGKGIVIRDETDLTAKVYRYFPTIMTFVQTCDSKPVYNFHEVIFGHQIQKPKFDIDGGDDDTMSQIIDTILSTFEELYNLDAKYIDYVDCDSSGRDAKTGEYKFSHHIIFPYLAFSNNQQASYFHKQVVKNLAYDPDAFICLDQQTNGKTQNFRIVGSQKNGRSLRIVQNDEDWILSDTLVTHTEHCNILPDILPDKWAQEKILFQKSMDNFHLDRTSEELEIFALICEKWLSKEYGPGIFSRGQCNGSTLLFDRVSISRHNCVLCDRIHAKIGCFFVLGIKYIRFYCWRAKGKNCIIWEKPNLDDNLETPPQRNILDSEDNLNKFSEENESLIKDETSQKMSDSKSRVTKRDNTIWFAGDENADVKCWRDFSKKYTSKTFPVNKNKLLSMMLSDMMKVCYVVDTCGSKSVVVSGLGDELEIEKFAVASSMNSKCMARTMNHNTISFSQILLIIKSEHGYKNLIFNPISTPPGSLNLFRGLLAKPVEQVDMTKIQFLLNHIRIVWAKQDNNLYSYILQWLGNILRGNKNGSAIVLYSSLEGAGKNIVTDFLRDFVIGSSYAADGQIEDVTGKFNSPYANKILTIVNEVPADGDKSHGYSVAERMKNLVTNQKFRWEKKGVDPIIVDDYNNFIFNTNYAAAIKISDSNRRFTMCECSNEKVGQTTYFNELLTYLKHPNGPTTASHFLKYVIDLPITMNVNKSHETSFEQNIKECYKLGDPIMQFMQSVKWPRPQASIQELYETYNKCNLAKLGINKFSSDLMNKEKYGDNVFAIKKSLPYIDGVRITMLTINPKYVDQSDYHSLQDYHINVARANAV